MVGGAGEDFFVATPGEDVVTDTLGGPDTLLFIEAPAAVTIDFNLQSR